MNKRLDTLILVVIIAAVLILFALTYKTWQIMKSHDHSQEKFIPLPEEPFNNKPDTVISEAVTKEKPVKDKDSYDSLSPNGPQPEIEPVKPDTQAKSKENRTPTKAQEKKSTPLPSVPVGSTGRYKVIAGSFSVHDNATRMAARLTEMGYTAEIVELDNSQFERVLAGRFSSRDQANEVVKLLEKRSIPSYVMIGY